MNLTPSPRYRSLLRACLVAMSGPLVLPLVQVVHAADGKWNSTVTGGLWGTTTNWSGGTVADGSGFTANFTVDIPSSSLTVNLNSARMIGNLIIGDSNTSSAGDWTLANNGNSANILTLAGSSMPTITVNNLGTNKGAFISLELAGTQGLIKAGTGTLTLSGANTYTGTTSVIAGILNLSGSLDTGSSLAVGNSGTFNLSSGSQTLSGLTVDNGQGTVNASAGTTLTLGAITRASGNGMVNFATSGTGNINTSAANTDGIIGAWAYTGTGAALDYAVSNGAGNAITALGATATLPSAGPGSSTANHTLSAGQTQTANTVANTLRYTGSAGTLALGANSLGLNGLMNAGSGLLTVTGTAGGPGLVTSGELDIVTNTGGITVSSVISGNGSVVVGGVGTTIGGTSSSATGVTTFGGVNTYTGGTVINSGALRASNAAALGSGAVTVANGAQLQIHGVNISNTLNIGGVGAILSSTGSGTGTASGSVNLLANSSVLTTSSAGNSNLAFTGSLNLSDYALTATAIGTANSVTISGTITGTSASSLVLNGVGVVRMTNNNTGYAGTTNVSGNGAILEVGNDGALGSGTLTIGSTGVYSTNPATVRSTDSTDRTLATRVIMGSLSAATYSFGATSTQTGNLTFTNTTDISLSSSKTLNILNSRTQFDAGFTGGSSTLTKTGAGTLVMNGTSTYTGATTISAGALQLGDGGATGSLSSSSAITNNSVFAVNRSNDALQGTDFGTISGTGGFVQSGSGTTTMTAGNSYTGTTTVSSGTLALGASNVFADTSNFVLSGGALSAGAFSDTVGTLSLTGNALITLGSGGALVFADSHLIDWGTFSLSISGTFVDGESIRFGSDGLGLTSDQLALISINGGAASIDASGFLVSSIPEPSTFGLLAGGALFAVSGVRRRKRRA